MKLRYTPKARADLRMIHNYIAVDLCNPDAADNVTKKIITSIANLKWQPHMGISLSEKTGIVTELFYIVTGKYMTFYKLEKNYISVVRILDVRTNYMVALFENERKTVN